MLPIIPNNSPLLKYTNYYIHLAGSDLAQYTVYMPAKNIVKIYVEGGYYHIYNRGIDKQIIFPDNDHYRVFLHSLKQILLPPKKIKPIPHAITVQGRTLQGITHKRKNYYGKIELLAYCLMPNHFHLLIHQPVSRAIDQFMQSLSIRYSLFFNKTHKRNGPLFQSLYKAINITEEPYLLHLSRYIHRNPLKYTKDIKNAYSSYGEYVGLRKTEWIKPEIILASFEPTKLPFLKHTNSYKSFVEYENEELDQYIDSALALESEDT
jgi:putative transposase